ncbi:hypothetical protein J1N35_018570, partial [Gossypium stocksii]
MAWPKTNKPVWPIHLIWRSPCGPHGHTHTIARPCHLHGYTLISHTVVSRAQLTTQPATRT